MNQHLITALIDLAVVVFALRKKDNPAAKALAVTALGLCLWSFELFLLRVVEDLDTLSLWFHLTRWGMFFIPPSFALLAWRLLGSRSQPFLNFVIIPCCVCSVGLSLANLLLFPTTLVPTDYGYFPKSDVIFLVFGINFLWAFVGALYFLIRCMKTVGFRDRQKVKWMLITFCVVFLAGLVTILIAPFNFYYSNFVGSFINVTFIALLFYSTIEHNLMEFRLVLSIGLTKIVLLGFSVWALIYFTSLTKPFDSPGGGMLSLVIFLVVTLELYPRALSWMLSRTKKILVGDAYDFDSTRTDLRDSLGESVNLQSFCSVFDNQLMQVVGIQNYVVLLVDHDGEFSIKGAGLGGAKRQVGIIDVDDPFFSYCSSFPGLVMADEVPSVYRDKFDYYKSVLGFCVTFESRPVALILIGQPSRETYYRYDDIRLFEWLQAELGQVLNRIRKLDEMQNQLGEAKKTLSMLGVMNHYHHDIKAPLSIIDGVLSNDIYDKEKQRDIVLEQVDRGSRLIATMAGVLKGERKRKVQAISLEEIVQDSLFLFSQRVDKVNLQFTDIPPIKGDAEDLKILVINIVKNAIEAKRQEQSLILTVSTWTTDSQIFLSFADTGAGMDTETLENLWESHSSDKKYGSGIGMQAIRRIADEHLAEIEVRSVKGSGSEFVFKFPIALASGPDPEPDNDHEKNIFIQNKRNNQGRA